MDVNSVCFKSLIKWALQRKSIISQGYKQYAHMVCFEHISYCRGMRSQQPFLCIQFFLPQQAVLVSLSSSWWVGGEEHLCVEIKSSIFLQRCMDLVPRLAACNCNQGFSDSEWTFGGRTTQDSKHDRSTYRKDLYINLHLFISDYFI